MDRFWGILGVIVMIAIFVNGLIDRDRPAPSQQPVGELRGDERPTPRRPTVSRSEKILDWLELAAEMVFGIDAANAKLFVREGDVFNYTTQFNVNNFIEQNGIESKEDVARFDRTARRQYYICSMEVLRDNKNKPYAFVIGKRAQCMRAAGYSDNDLSYINAKKPVWESVR